MNVQRLIETYNTYEEPQDWAEQAKEALWQLQNALEQETTMLRQQQAEIEVLKEEIASWQLTDQEILEIRNQQAEIEKLRSWVEMLVEVPFFEEIDHYRGIPIAILRKVQE